jgi:hypothetical protein
MIERSQVVNRYDFINAKWHFFKKWLRDITKCYYVKNLKIDEITNTLTFQKVYQKSGIKFESKVTMEALWEEKQHEGEKMTITIYVREQKEDGINEA